MKINSFFLGLLLVLLIQKPQLTYSQKYDPRAVDIARALSRDIFELNGVPYLESMVKIVNASSNARFFQSAYIPKKSEKPYFRFSIHSMFGFVKDDMKTYNPMFPMDSFDLNQVSRFIDIDIINQKYNIKDTSALIYYLFKTVIYDGYTSGSIKFPQTAPTILGGKGEPFIFDKDTLRNLVKRNYIYPFLPQNIQDTVMKTVEAIPNYYTLPSGGDFSSIFAFVPQFEIGSIYGTEALIRFIPPVRFDDEIGDFAFWAIAFKHSISQYFHEFPIDLAFQAAYQGTYLKNNVGVTNSELKANGTFWNFNLHGSKRFGEHFEIFSGISTELLSINTKFKYFLGVEQQYSLGLLEGKPDENGNIVIQPPNPPEYPGDTLPQTSELIINNTNFKFTIGMKGMIGPIGFFADYSISQFNIFSGGIEVSF